MVSEFNIDFSSELESPISDLDRMQDWPLVDWTKEQIFSPKYFDIKNIIANSFSELQSLLKSKNIQMSDLSQETVFIKVDYHIFSQALRNILLNAIEYNRVDGNISISYQEVGEDLILKIKDSGIGIPEYLNGSLFEFGDDRMKVQSSKEKLISYGLVMSKDCIEKHGGSIQIEETSDQGTVRSRGGRCKGSP